MVERLVFGEVVVKCRWFQTNKTKSQDSPSVGLEGDNAEDCIAFNQVNA